MEIGQVWGAGSFDNEAAMRWLETLEEAADLDPLEAILDEIIECGDAGDVPEGPTASHAIAAAETIAALATNPSGSLPEEVRQWCFDNPGLELDDVVLKAIQALGVVLQDSELRHHFDELGQLDAWENEVEALRDRLR